MMQSEYLQSSWPLYGAIDLTLDQLDHYGLSMDAYVSGGCQFSPSLTSTEEACEMSSISHFSNVFSSDFVRYPLEEFQLDLEGFESIMSHEMEGLYGFFDESEGSFPSKHLPTEGEDLWSPSPSVKSNELSMDIILTPQPSLTLPGEDMEIDNQLSIFHLLKAFGEATEKEHKELAEVIMRCISQKASSVGEPLVRLAFYLSRDSEKQGNYLLQESCKNFQAAFRAFYQILPYGRFAHFAANTAILESLPDDAETIHIVDFDIGEGVQWPPMIEAIARQRKTLRLTSIKREDQYQDFASHCAPSQWRFEETRRQLCDHARSVGLKLKMEEICIQESVSEINRMKKRGGRKEWLAYNCMVGLPHMGRGKRRKLVEDFLRAAKESLANTGNSVTTNRGIIIYGDGDASEKLKGCMSFHSFFDVQSLHYQALLESLEANFPKHLAEARLAMETLFVAPYVSSHAWLQKWEDMREGFHLETGSDLQGWKVTREALMEAEEMVRGEESYRVGIGGQSQNEVVLEWRGTPLVTVSSWTN